jgi:hypothetical protein
VVAVLLDEFISTVATEKAAIEDENLREQRAEDEALHPTVTVSILRLILIDACLLSSLLGFHVSACARYLFKAQVMICAVGSSH